MQSVNRSLSPEKTDSATGDGNSGVKLGGIPPDLRSGMSCLRSITRRLFAGIHQSTQFTLEYFSLCMMFCKKCSPSRPRSFCHLLSVGRCCKRQTLFKCHESQTECLGCLKPLKPLEIGNPTSALGPSGSRFGPSSLTPIGIHHPLLSNLTTMEISRLFVYI